jgi:hypothetical protein
MARFLSHTPAARPAAQRFVTSKMQIAPQGLNNYSGEMTRCKCVKRHCERAEAPVDCDG